MRSQISIPFLIPMSIIIIVIIFQMLWIKNLKKKQKLLVHFQGIILDRSSKTSKYFLIMNWSYNSKASCTLLLTYRSHSNSLSSWPILTSRWEVASLRMWRRPLLMMMMSTKNTFTSTRT